MTKVVLRGLVSKNNRPPIVSIIFREILNPKPVPFPARLVVKNG